MPPKNCLFTTLFPVLLPIFPIALLSTSAQAFNPDHLAQLLKTNQCANCDLSGANLEKANLTGANLQGANLSGATLTNTNLSGANLEAANLQGTSLTEAYLFRANLTGTNFTNAGLQKANLRETTLVGTNFSGADLRSSDFQGNNLAQAKFSGSNLSNANLSKTIAFAILNRLTGQDQAATLYFMPQALCPFDQNNSLIADNGPARDPANAFTEESGFKLQTTDFSRTNLTAANFQKSVLVGTDLSNVDLTGANLRSACLVSVNFTGAKLKQADLTDVRLMSTRLPPGTAKPTLSDAAQASAKESTRSRKTWEAKMNVGTMNRVQQAYYLENDRFTTNVKDLDLGVMADSETYKYRLFIAPNRYPAIMNVALSQRDDLPTFVGFVHIGQLAGESTTIAILCTSEKPATPMPLWSAIDYKNPKKGEPIACPKGFTPVK